MDETKQVPNQNPIIPTPPIVTYTNPLLASTSKTPWMLILLIVVLFGTASYFGYQNYQLKQQLTAQQPTPSESPKIVINSPAPSTSAVVTEDSMGNWETYKNAVRKYTVQFPSDWKIDKSKAETSMDDPYGAVLTISKGEYSINITWPNAYGPGLCIFDDQPRIDDPGMIGTCEGEFVEFKSNSGKSINRRLVKPDTLKGFVQWPVYSKNEDVFVTVPPMSFKAPLKYELSDIETMDQILSTLNFFE